MYSNISWNSLQTRPQTVRKYDAHTDTSDVQNCTGYDDRDFLTSKIRIWIQSGIKVTSRILIRIKMVWWPATLRLTHRVRMYITSVEIEHRHFPNSLVDVAVGWRHAGDHQGVWVSSCNTRTYTVQYGTPYTVTMVAVSHLYKLSIYGTKSVYKSKEFLHQILPFFSPGGVT
jgi:hypothetical protein